MPIVVLAPLLKTVGTWIWRLATSRAAWYVARKGLKTAYRHPGKTAATVALLFPEETYSAVKFAAREFRRDIGRLHGISRGLMPREKSGGEIQRSISPPSFRQSRRRLYPPAPPRIRGPEAYYRR